VVLDLAVTGVDMGAIVVDTEALAVDMVAVVATEEEVATVEEASEDEVVFEVEMEIIEVNAIFYCY